MPAFEVADVLARADGLRDVLGSFEPGVLSCADAAVVAEALARTEKACAGARARAAARAIAGGQHKRRGFPDGADWLARHLGTTVGGARCDVEVAQALEDLPATSAAVAAGEISLSQAAEVARAEKKVTGSEAELLELARRTGLGPVRERARQIILDATDPKKLADEHHKARYFRHWRDGDGMVRLSGALPPEVGVGLMNRLDAEANRLRRAVDGEKERFEAYAADALTSMLAGQGTGTGIRSEVVLVLDTRAYWRGHTHPGELCHILGGGPVPVDWAKRLMGNAFVKAVLHNGERVQRVAHFGRHMKAELRTALELGRPPDFDGVKCSEPGCDRRYGLEWDHVDPVANKGPTSYANLQPLCKPHHWEKTERDRQAGLHGQRGP